MIPRWLRQTEPARERVAAGLDLDERECPELVDDAGPVALAKRGDRRRRTELTELGRGLHHLYRPPRRVATDHPGAARVRYGARLHAHPAANRGQVGGQLREFHGAALYREYFSFD
jgi:hypothetical protein